MKCYTKGCESTELVYSGIDALLLGVNTEKWCYPCANAIYQARQEKAGI